MVAQCIVATVKNVRSILLHTYLGLHLGRGLTADNFREHELYVICIHIEMMPFYSGKNQGNKNIFTRVVVHLRL